MIKKDLAMSGDTMNTTARIRSALIYSLGLTAVIGLLESQIQHIVTLPDALTIALAFALGYAVSVFLKLPLIPRLVVSAIPGVSSRIASTASPMKKNLNA